MRQDYAAGKGPIILVRVKITCFVQHIQLQQARQHIGHTAAADADGRLIADGMQPHLTVFHRGMIDRAGRALHTILQIGSLKSRACRRRAAQKPVILPEGNFPIGTDIRQQCCGVTGTNTAGQQRCGNIRTDKSGHTARQIHDCVRRAGQIQTCGRNCLSIPLTHDKGRGSKRGRIVAGKQVQHRSIAGDNKRIYLAGLCTRCLTRLTQ